MLEETIKTIQPLNPEYRTLARAKLNRLTKPIGLEHTKIFVVHVMTMMSMTFRNNLTSLKAYVNILINNLILAKSVIARKRLLVY